jgi:hypothetical protein
MKKTIYIILTLALLSGCVKETDWPIPEQPEQKVVVDAIITDEAGSQSIRINYAVNQLNETPKPVQGADVVISDADSAWQLAEDSLNPGLYRPSASFLARLDKTYTLIIFLNGHIYSAKTYMAPGSVFNELQYLKNTDDSLYHIEWVADAFSYGSPAMWEILLDWSKVPGYENADSTVCKARMLFYTLPTLDVSEIFAPIMESISFPVGTIITERRYSVTPGHAEFLREMLLETNWTGGLFCVANSNVTTNFSEGAVGYFGACSVTSLSLTVTP